jgi:hypothetical protein
MSGLHYPEYKGATGWNKREGKKERKEISAAQ